MTETSAPPFPTLEDWQHWTLVMGRAQHAATSSGTRLAARAVWDFVEFVFSSLVFILIGLQLNAILGRFKPGEADPNKQFQGWAGVTDLPEIDKRSPSFRAFAYGDKDSVTQLWLDRGAAGWRMDVAPWVPDDFWREWRRAVKA